MKIFITGICGFVGSSLALELKRHIAELGIFGMDNLGRPGSERNRDLLKRAGIAVRHGDLRQPSDLETVSKADWVIDAAANPSVVAGVTGPTSSRQLMEHNLSGTLHLLEYCKRHGAGLLLLSTSRVYSAAALAALPMETRNNGLVPRWPEIRQAGLSAQGLSELFPTAPPISLYGAAKLASEILALEYGLTFDFPVQINRCGILAGAGQFGKPDQGIIAYWIHGYRQARPLTYIGWGGTGGQVRDIVHPHDLAALIAVQIRNPRPAAAVANIGGGLVNSVSLAQLNQWCEARFGPRPVRSVPESRPFDVPWLVLDSARAGAAWNWQPTTRLESIFEEIAVHAEQHPHWLELSEET